MKKNGWPAFAEDSALNLLLFSFMNLVLHNIMDMYHFGRANIKSSPLVSKYRVSGIHRIGHCHCGGRRCFAFWSSLFHIIECKELLQLFSCGLVVLFFGGFGTANSVHHAHEIGQGRFQREKAAHGGSECM